MGYDCHCYIGKIWNQSKNAHERYKKTFIYMLSVLYKIHWNFIGTTTRHDSLDYVNKFGSNMEAIYLETTRYLLKNICNT